MNGLALLLAVLCFTKCSLAAAESEERFECPLMEKISSNLSHALRRDLVSRDVAVTSAVFSPDLDFRDLTFNDVWLQFKNDILPLTQNVTEVLARERRCLVSAAFYDLVLSNPELPRVERLRVELMARILSLGQLVCLSTNQTGCADQFRGLTLRATGRATDRSAFAWLAMISMYAKGSGDTGIVKSVLESANMSVLENLHSQCRGSHACISDHAWVFQYVSDARPQQSERKQPRDDTNLLSALLVGIISGLLTAAVFSTKEKE